MSLANFVIHDIDDPWTDDLPTATHNPLTSALDGHCDRLRTGNIAVWIEDNPAERITVWIAEPKRVAVLEARDEITYANLHLLPA